MWKILHFFARFYTPGKFIRFIQGTGRRIRFMPKLLAIFYCMQDEDTPKVVKLALMGALGYVIPVSYTHLRLDDAAVVAAALHFAGTYLKPEHKEKVRHMFPFVKL